MKNSRIDFTLCFFSLLVILISVGLIAFNPDSANEYITKIFTIVTDIIGIPLLWFGFIALIYCFFIAWKHGNIRLGNRTPTYSLFSYISMIICAGLGSAFVIWSLVEWAFYYSNPALGIETASIEAAEWATAYNFFHWGFTPWAMFLIATIPMSYAYYIRKIPALRFSVICEVMIGKRKFAKPIGKLVEFVFVFSVVGALAMTLGLGVPMIAEIAGNLLNFTPTFATDIYITIIIAILFSISSYIGIEKGMRILSSFNIYFAIICLIVLFFVGPTKFIISETTNGLGLMLQNFIRMSFNTDPIRNEGFPQTWTIFFYAFGIVFSGLMALFITKISQGRTMREMIYVVIIGGPIGCFLFFGINGSFSMNLHLTEQLDVVTSLLNEGNGRTVIAILETLPFPKIAIISFLILITLFLATTLDSAAFSLSAASTNQLSQSENTSPTLRLFWCISLTLIPLSMKFIGAPLNALQTLTIITSLPLVFVLLFMNYRFLDWIKTDTQTENLTK